MRFYKNKRYIGIEDGYYKTWKGRPYNRYTVDVLAEVIPGMEHLSIPRGYIWRSQSRVVPENPIDVLERGEEIISTEPVRSNPMKSNPGTSRKNYIVIAAALRSVRPQPYTRTGVASKQFNKDCNAVSLAMRADNPRFDRGRFMDACGVKEEWEWRKNPMSRKHYKSIAAELAYVKPSPYKGVAKKQYESDVNAVAAALKADNPRFDNTRFMKAAGVGTRSNPCGSKRKNPTAARKASPRKNASMSRSISGKGYAEGNVIMVDLFLCEISFKTRYPKKEYEAVFYVPAITRMDAERILDKYMKAEKFVSEYTVMKMRRVMKGEKVKSQRAIAKR